MSVLKKHRSTVDACHRRAGVGVLEVHREPRCAGSASRPVSQTGVEAAPLVFPDAVVGVADILWLG